MNKGHLGARRRRRCTVMVPDGGIKHATKISFGGDSLELRELHLNKNERTVSIFPQADRMNGYGRKRFSTGISPSARRAVDEES